ncbi:hypothetical protein J3E71DRAFT_220679 [Bipolaris maydis]|nr:hypothetical protein J3E71DRAFT_220679 [Bipolaris maydis]
MAATTAPSNHTVTAKAGNSPQPHLPSIGLAPPRMEPPPPPLNQKDPENYLKRCSGYCKKTNLRCSASIGKKAQKDTRPTYLPTCALHRDQQSLAGWCQFTGDDGRRCARLFRWSPPHFELCSHHQGHPSTPCYFLKHLPLELRHEVYRYLIPTEPIDSSTAAVHDRSSQEPDQRAARLSILSYPSPMRATRVLRSKFPMRLLDLLTVSRQVHDEVKDRLFSTVTFKIDIRKDGTFMCGRRLLEPKRADGSSHFLFDEADHAKRKFLKYFDWASAKNYAVDILLENCPIANPHHVPNMANMTMRSRWDEEVEIYDIRDYISVVVSGILAKAKNLYKLQVRLCLADFAWQEEQILSNSKLLFSPFERLRNVRQPTLGGVFTGRPDSNSMYPIERTTGRYPLAAGTGCIQSALPAYYELCSVPSLPTDHPVLLPGIPAFDAYATEWRRQISSKGTANVLQEPLIRKMFTEFRNFYTEFANHVPDITLKSGRHTFLHRARVAREQEDVIAFRAIRAELLDYWTKHLEDQERKKRTMETRIARFLQSDKYPSHVWEEPIPVQSPDALPTQISKSPVALDTESMARDGIPMTGNLIQRSCPPPPYRQMNQHSGQQDPYVNPRLINETAEQYASMKRRQLQQRFLQQQALQQQLIRQQVQLARLEHEEQYSPAGVLLQQRDYLLKRKAANELNKIYQQANFGNKQDDEETSLPRRNSDSSHSSHSSQDAMHHTTTSYNKSNATSGPGVCTEFLQPIQQTNHLEPFSPVIGHGEPGPSTKRCRTDSGYDGKHRPLPDEEKIEGVKHQGQVMPTWRFSSFDFDADVMQQPFTGKGKERV